MYTNFNEDLSLLYSFFTKMNKDLAIFYDGAKDIEINTSKLLERFLEENNLPKTPELKLALAKRLVILRFEPMKKELTKIGVSKEGIQKIADYAYDFAANLHLKKFEEVLNKMDSAHLLNPFYRTILWGTHQVGIKMNALHLAWKKHILETPEQADPKITKL